MAPHILPLLGGSATRSLLLRAAGVSCFALLEASVLFACAAWWGLGHVTPRPPPSHTFCSRLLWAPASRCLCSTAAWRWERGRCGAGVGPGMQWGARLGVAVRLTVVVPAEWLLRPQFTHSCGGCWSIRHRCGWLLVKPASLRVVR